MTSNTKTLCIGPTTPSITPLTSSLSFVRYYLSETIIHGARTPEISDNAKNMAATTVSSPAPVAMQSYSTPAKNNERPITVLLTTFAGLGLPRTLSFPTIASASVNDVLQTIYSRLPQVDHPLVITTTSNRQLQFSNLEPVSTLLTDKDDTFLPLRLSARLCGGKGGFGSQLRAAGGRMSSRKNRNQQNQNPNGSNRNLDGRRLRTVDEAKRLAEYLAIKPGMDQKEKDERKKRWEKVVEEAEKKEEMIKSGKMGSGQGRLDAEYVESKDLAEEKTREAVLKAMREGTLDLERTGSESSMEVDDEGSEDEAEEENSRSSEDVTDKKDQSSGPTYFGWDDDEDEESEEEDEGPLASEQPTAYEGKGKDKAA